MQPGVSVQRAKCERCLRPQSHCLCALIPSLTSQSAVMILQHASEAGHALNTARLAHLGLANSQLFIGERFDPSLWQDSALPVCVLFPGEGAVPLSASAGPQQLIVLDGTWRKARKLLHVNPLLAALPRVCLPAPTPSRYRLRKAPGEGAVSTLEAIVQALEVMETPRSFQALLAPFEALIEGQIHAMGPAVYARNHHTS